MSFDVAAQFRQQMVVGTGSACIWVTACHPFDTIKTRLQLQGTSSASMLGTFLRMTRKEGVMSLWRGMPPVLAVQALKSSLGWFGYQYFNSLLNNRRDDFETYSYVKSGLAGSMSGLLVGWLIVPSELIKVRMQNSVSTHALAAKCLKVNRVYDRHLDCCRSLYRQAGIRGFYAGTGPTAGRLVTAWCFYFGVQECLEDWFKGTKDTALPSTPTESFVAGGIAGIVSWAVSMPFDTIKTRIQTNPHVYKSGWHCLKEILREGGVRNLYTGFDAVILRSFVANGLAFATYRKGNQLYNDLTTANSLDLHYNT